MTQPNVLPLQVKVDNYPYVTRVEFGDAQLSEVRLRADYPISPILAFIQAVNRVSSEIASELRSAYNTGALPGRGTGTSSDPIVAGIELGYNVNGSLTARTTGAPSQVASAVWRRVGNTWYYIGRTSRGLWCNYILNGVAETEPTAVRGVLQTWPRGGLTDGTLVTVNYRHGRTMYVFNEPSAGPESYWASTQRAPTVRTSQGLMPQPAGITEGITYNRLAQILAGADSAPSFAQERYFFSIKTETDVPNTLASALTHHPPLVLPKAASGDGPLRYRFLTDTDHLHLPGGHIFIYEDPSGSGAVSKWGTVRDFWSGSDPDNLFIGRGNSAQIPTSDRGVYHNVFQVQDRNGDTDTCDVTLLIYNEGENAFITAPTFAQDRYDYTLELDEPASGRSPLPTGHDPFDLQWVSGDLPDGLELYAANTMSGDYNVRVVKGTYYPILYLGGNHAPRPIVLGGTPIEEGTFAITLRARDVVGDTVDTVLRFVVLEAVDPEPPAPEPEPPPMPTPENPLRWVGDAIPDLNFTEGDSILRGLRAAQGGTPPYTYVLSGRPSWLTFDPSTSVPTISGTAETGVHSLSLTVTDSADTPASIKDDFKLTVTALPPASVPSFAQTEYPFNVARGQTVNLVLPLAEGGVGALTYTTTGAVSLPTGISVQDGMLTGNVGQGAALTTYSFRWTATDENKASASTTITIFVVEGVAPNDPDQPIAPDDWVIIPADLNDPVQDEASVWTADEWRRFIINNMIYLKRAIDSL